MTMPPTPPSPLSPRLRELQRYEILDTPAEEALERVVDLAQRIFKVPIVLLGFLAADRQWFKARRGFKPCEIELSSSFCVHMIEDWDVTVVPDATQDDRFYDSPLVSGPSAFRFYAGAPLISSSGHVLGTLCLFDTQPRDNFTPEAQENLRDLASVVMDELELRLAELQRRHSTHRIETIFENITDAFYLLDHDWCFSFLNRQAETLLQRNKEDLLGNNVWAEFPEAKDSPVYQHYTYALATGESVVFEIHYLPLAAWFEVHAYPSEEGLSVYFQDITERKKVQYREEIQAEFRRSLLTFTQSTLQHGLQECFYQELLEIAVRTIPGAQAGSLLIRQEDGHHFVAAVGFDLAALSSCTFQPNDFLFDLYSPEPQKVFSWQVEELDTSRREVMETHGLSNDIAVSLCVPILSRSEPYLSLYLDNFDTPAAFDDDAVSMARELTQHVAALMQRYDLEASLIQKQSELEHLAHYDAVTGLPNRVLFNDRLEQAAAQSRRTGRPLAVMFLDLDDFKQVNDTYGHAFGDVLLARIAKRLGSNMREGDTLARWGGDEFVVMIPEFEAASELESIAKRLLAVMRRPFTLEDREITANVTIGIDASATGLAVAEDLVKNADMALYRAKAVRGGYEFFTVQMQEQLRIKVELGEDLRAALTSDLLTLYYQPRIDLQTGRIASLEALARWQHPSRGWVAPSVFIPLAEEIGLIGDLGARILDKACAQAKAWELQGIGRRVAVNLSNEQLKHPDIVGDVEFTLRAHELPPELLELEITESTAMTDVADSIRKLQCFRDMGIQLAIDDFGTAYSSLAYLDRLPVHSLKIDRSFVSRLVNEDFGKGQESSIVQTILALGKSLGLCVVAEGVETEAQCAVLKRLGCDEAQGYLFAAPMPADVFETALLSKFRATDS